MNLIVEALSMMVLFMSFTHIILVSVGKPELSYFEIVNKKLFIKRYVFDTRPRQNQITISTDDW